jgi:(S)-2-hydroxyglutarate dehydrogenase
MIDGSIHAGPNAVPALKREGYRWRDVSLRDSAEIVRARSTWVLARRYWRKEVGEIHRSLSTRAFLQALRRLCPELTRADLEPSASGVRAQAIALDGTLLDDFAFADSPRAVHVMNAPSPAATASFAIATTVAERHDRLLSSA